MLALGFIVIMNLNDCFLSLFERTSERADARTGRVSGRACGCVGMGGYGSSARGCDRGWRCVGAWVGAGMGRGEVRRGQREWLRE